MVLLTGSCTKFQLVQIEPQLYNTVDHHYTACMCDDVLAKVLWIGLWRYIPYTGGPCKVIQKVLIHCLINNQSLVQIAYCFLEKKNLFKIKKKYDIQIF